MSITFDQLRAHLERTGRMKLLPQILRELKQRKARARLTAPRRESAAERPELISGSRQIAEGILVDTTGKRALLEIYKNVTR